MEDLIAAGKAIGILALTACLWLLITGAEEFFQTTTGRRLKRWLHTMVWMVGAAASLGAALYSIDFAKPIIYSFGWDTLGWILLALILGFVGAAVALGDD